MRYREVNITPVQILFKKIQVNTHRVKLEKVVSNKKLKPQNSSPLENANA